MRKPKTQVEYMGYIIEKGAAGFYVIDWDYEGDGATLNGGMPFKSLWEAESYIRGLS